MGDLALGSPEDKTENSSQLVLLSIVLPPLLLLLVLQRAPTCVSTDAEYPNTTFGGSSSRTVDAAVVAAGQLDDCRRRRSGGHGSGRSVEMKAPSGRVSNRSTLRREGSDSREVSHEQKASRGHAPDGSLPLTLSPSPG